jgi:hypothetical protein
VITNQLARSGSITIGVAMLRLSSRSAIGIHWHMHYADLSVSLSRSGSHWGALPHRNRLVGKAGERENAGVAPGNPKAGILGGQTGPPVAFPGRGEVAALTPLLVKSNTTVVPA